MNPTKKVQKTIGAYTQIRGGKVVPIQEHEHGYHVKVQLSKKELQRIKTQKSRNLQKLQKLQIKEKDWAHLSVNYPNIIGITDKDIDKFLNRYPTKTIRREEKDLDNLIATFPYPFNYSSIDNISLINLEAGVFAFANRINNFLSNHLKWQEYETEKQPKIKKLIKLLKNFQERGKELELISKAYKGSNTWYSEDLMSLEYKKKLRILGKEIKNSKYDNEILLKKFKLAHSYPDSYNRNREEVEEYIKNIKCYNKNDIREISKKMFKEFDKNCLKKYRSNKLATENNAYNQENTVFVTSPRGGLEVLANFAYANNLSKRKLPTDFYSKEDNNLTVLCSRAMPYGNSVRDVNDIVFIDDVFMSGDQELNGLQMMTKLMRILKIDNSQKPRMHYMSLAGSTERLKRFKEDRSYLLDQKKNWDSYQIGDPHDIDGKYDEKLGYNLYPDGSAFIFPFSLPDGSRHGIANELLRSAKTPINIH